MVLNEDFFDDVNDEDLVNTDIDDSQEKFNLRLTIQLNTHFYNSHTGQDGKKFHTVKEDDDPIVVIPKLFYKMLPVIMDMTPGIISYGDFKYTFENSIEDNCTVKAKTRYNLENKDYYTAENNNPWDENYKYVHFSLECDFKKFSDVLKFINKLLKLDYKNRKVVEFIRVNVVIDDVRELPMMSTSIAKNTRKCAQFYKYFLKPELWNTIVEVLDNIKFKDFVIDMFTQKDRIEYPVENVRCDDCGFLLVSLYPSKKIIECEENEFYSYKDDEYNDLFNAYKKEYESVGITGSLVLVGERDYIGVNYIGTQTFSYKNEAYVPLFYKHIEVSDGGAIRMIKEVSKLINKSPEEVVGIYKDKFNVNFDKDILEEVNS